MEASYALIAALIIFLIIVADGLKRLAGTSTPQLRPRGANQTLAEWLMGKEMLAKSDLKLPDLRVKIERSAAFPSEWSCNVPPQLAASPGTSPDRGVLARRERRGADGGRHPRARRGGRGGG